jgi:hypothetical protein
MLLVVLLPITAYCQISIKIGASAGLLYSYRQLALTNNTPVGTMVKNSRDSEQPDWGSLFGLNCIIPRNKWQVETGICFTTSGYKYSNNNVRLGDPIDDQFGFVQNPGAPKQQSYEIQYIYNMLRVPFIIGYVLNVSTNQRHQLVPQLGFSNNVLVKAHREATIKYDDGSTATQSSNSSGAPYNTYSVSAQGGLTYMYTIRKLSITGSFVFNQSLTPVFSGTSISEYEYWGAAKLGLFYRVN